MPHRALSAVVFVMALLALPAGVHAQDDAPMTISIYHVAPGQHVAFLEWMAERDAIAAEIGAPQSQWYGHMEGASWDFLSISAPVTDAQQDEMDAMAEERGLTTGFAAAMELRTMIASHTDTEVAGPMTATEVVAALHGEGME